MTYVDLIALISGALVLLAIGGVIADWMYAETRSSRRYQARRIR